MSSVATADRIGHGCEEPRPPLDLPLVPWERVEARLSGGSLAGTAGPDNRSWLATISPDGSPHLTGSDRCGWTAYAEAALVEDPAVVVDLAGRWNAGGWPAEPDGSGVALTADFSAPSAGPPPWRVYRLTPSAITVVLASAPGGATRWTF